MNKNQNIQGKWTTKTY